MTDRNAMHGDTRVRKQHERVWLVGNGLHFLDQIGINRSVSASRRRTFTLIEIEVPSGRSITLKPKVEKSRIQSHWPVKMRATDACCPIARRVVNELAVQGDVPHWLDIANARLEILKWFADAAAKRRVQILDDVSEKRDDFRKKCTGGVITEELLPCSADGRIPEDAAGSTEALAVRLRLSATEKSGEAWELGGQLSIERKLQHAVQMEMRERVLLDLLSSHCP